MKSTALATLTAVFAVGAAGGAVQAQPYDPNGYYNYRHHHHHHHYYRARYDRSYDECAAERRSQANTGTALGAVGGGILGSALGGGRLGNTLLGAGAGALAGHAIAKNNVRC